MKKDYSEYKPSAEEHYDNLRKNNEFIEYNYFDNKVSYSVDNKKTFYITVDYSKEDDFAGYVNDDDEDVILRDIAQNDMDFNKLSSKYKIQKFDCRDKKIPLNNVLSGCRIEMSVGEGILDFIYANFDQPFYMAINFYLSFRDLLEADFGDLFPNRNKKKPPRKIKSKEHEDAIKYLNYKHTCYMAKGINYSSLYSSICPPVFMNYDKDDYQLAFNLYFGYLKTLQKEYLELIEFCFDEEVCTSDLGKLTPAERFFIYIELKELPLEINRKEEFSLSIADDVIDIENEDLQELSNKFGIEESELIDIIQNHKSVSVSYQVSSIRDMLELEFTKMLERDIRFRKCKRCGRYFIMKGNYDTNYCDRIAEGETKNCQDIMAMEKYKQKTEDIPAIKIYNKYYKRYSARVKVHTILEDDFKKWKYQAVAKRDECIDGKITEDESVKWMEDCFPNRNRKH
ncbi:MAG: DUF6076 domain-containing protein [Acetobacter sp.]|nr:DUF6076 domain-containing protein [Bacteroides sp.]MCM1341682.1 DUF6076 domain-containing protein [Acetobacter sp.]MCM1432380.1 DUF6076 domain-containing protein [Clostridiales bacterium]